MKFSKLRKGLIGIAIFLMAQQMTFAGDIGLVVKQQAEKEQLRSNEVAKELMEKGTTINRRIVEKGLILTIQSVYVDTYSYRMLYSIEKEDHTAFDDIDQLIPVESCLRPVDYTGETYIDYCTATSKRCEMPDSSDKKIYFISYGGVADKMKEKELFYTHTFQNHKDEYNASSFSLEKYFKEEKTQPKVKENEQVVEMIKNLEKKYEAGSYEYIHEKQTLERFPMTVLGEGNLGIQLLNDNPNLTIDNIGFIDDELHIRIIDKGNEPLDTNKLCLLDKNNKWVKGDCWLVKSIKPEKKDDGKEAYYENVYYCVFERINKGQLKDLSMIINTFNYQVELSGPWACKLDYPLNLKMVTKRADQMVPYGVERVEGKARLVKADITPQAIYLSFDKVEKGKLLGENRIQVQMKDGTILDDEMLQSEEYDYGIKNECYCLFINQGKLIDVDQVASIIINGEVVSIQ